MWEITDLVQQFHKEIVLSAEVLYERFGLENGENLLAPYFPEIQMRRYEDAIEIAEAEPLISYILSCHGNQNQLLLNQYKEFRNLFLPAWQMDFISQKRPGSSCAENS